MSNENQIQIRSIGDVVSELQPQFPDISHSSLRFLEREGFVRPTRTEGGHRLYTAADVERIVRIKRWQAERLSLEQIRGRLRELDRLPNRPELVNAFVRYAAAGQLNQAGELIAHADQIGLPLATLFGEVLTPALHEIGDLWERGEISVAREKEISELSRELIIDLTRRHVAPDLDGPVIVAACVEGEQHELGLRMITGLLRERGYRVSFLGADVGLAFLLTAVEERSPAAVLLSAKQPHTRPALELALSALNAARGDFAIIAGGDIAEQNPALITHYGAIPVPNADASLGVTTIEMAISAGEPE